MRRPTRHDLRAAGWAAARLRATRRDLRGLPVEEVRLRPPPPLPSRAGRVVHVVLRAGRATCLERALILQAWHRAHGHPLDVIIGVRPPSEGFEAHAWLDGERDGDQGRFTELTRLAADRP